MLTTLLIIHNSSLGGFPMDRRDISHKSQCNQPYKESEDQTNRLINTSVKIKLKTFNEIHWLVLISSIKT